MQGEAELVGQGTRLVVVEPFVEAEMLAAHPAGASHHPEPFVPSSSAQSFSASIIDGDPPGVGA
jgi:hypothetical protein